MIELRKVLVIFGSQSDADVYEDILQIFADKGIDFDLKIASAHRTPELVAKILNDYDYDVIISGAGLAAHLPGVIASKTIKPVIGVPVDGNYQGLDALLSIMQMPPGIPVIGVGVNNAKAAALNTVKMLKPFKGITIVGDSDLKPVKRARDMMEQFDQAFKVDTEIDKETINIKFIELGDKIEESDALIIYCPLSDEDSASSALNLLKMSTHGLWVGLNRGENAALAALQIANLDSHHNETFGWYRKSMAEKVEKANQEVEKNDS